MKALNVIDPENGGVVTIGELAEKHGIRAGTLYWRYQRGRRGWDLVAPLNKQCKRGNAISNGIAKRKKATSSARAEIINAARSNPLTRPFHKIAKEAQ